MRTTAIILAAFAAMAAAYPEEKDVLVLDESNFDDAIAEFDPLLVEFYAPWCGHCKRLEPEYAAAAAELKKDGIRIAKVDATENRALGDKFGVRGFPTLKFFRGGKATEYGGGRTQDTITSWVRKRSGPPASTLGTAEEAARFTEDRDVAVVGFFADAESAEAKAFVKVAAGNDKVEFGIVSDAAVATSLEAEMESVVLFKQFDEGRVDYAGSLTSPDQMAEFVSANQLPLVIPFNEENAEKIFAGSIKTHFLFFVDDQADGYDQIVADFTSVAKQNKGSLLFITVGADQNRVMEYFGVTEDSMPTAYIVDMPDGGQMKKFELPAGDVNEEALAAFTKSYLAGDLKPSLKSEDPAPEDLEGDVVVVKGKSFEEIALDDSKDVLVEFYAPWCGHCKRLAPTYEKLGQRFAGVDSVVIAKMDATANEIDHPGVNVGGFPTLYFFPSNSDGKVMDYDGARTLDGFVEFIQKNAGTEFTLSDEVAEDDDDMDDDGDL